MIKKVFQRQRGLNRQLVAEARQSALVMTLAITVGEIIFIVLFGVLVPAFLCVLPFPVAGYFGCKKWSFCLLQVFTIYTFLECLLGITSLFFFYKEPIFFSIRCIDIVFNMVTFYYAKQLSAFAHNLGPDDINFLQNDPTIKAIEQGLF